MKMKPLIGLVATLYDERVCSERHRRSVEARARLLGSIATAATTD